MMPPQLLERGSHFFRKGYRAGYAGEVCIGSDNQTFAGFDFDQGYRAGQKDRKWDLDYAARRNGGTK